MVAYTRYESDNRVRRYAEALAKRGDHVDVVALRQEGQAASDVINGVRVFRIQRRIASEKNKFMYLGKLCLFFVRSMAFLTREQFRNRYDLIDVHSVPDFEVFAAAYPKLTGTKIILDIHDIVPEFYAKASSRLPMIRWPLRCLWESRGSPRDFPITSLRRITFGKNASKNVPSSLPNARQC